MTEKTSFGDRLRIGLRRTRDILNADVVDLARGRRPLQPEDIDAMEERLIAADFGLASTQAAMDVVRARSSEIWTGGLPAMRALLKQEIRGALERPLPFTLCALAAGVGYGASFVGAMNRFTTLTPADHRATLGSLFYLAGYVGSGLAILAVGALVDAIELMPAMGVVAVCLVAGSLGLVLTRRRVRPPPPAA